MRIFMLVLLVLSLASCKTGSGGDGDGSFSVSGKILNSTAKMVYMEKVSAASMQPLIADSSKLGTDGSFSLKTEGGEAVVYNIRLDQNRLPVASVINDTDKVKLTIELSKENNQFAEKYEVEGSPASMRMKTFMYDFNNDLQKIFALVRKTDSLQRGGAPDSVLSPLTADRKALAEKVKSYTFDALDKANNPALIMFELGYYQSTANGTGFGLEPLSDEKIHEIVSQTSQRFPQHNATALIKASLDNELARSQASSWVGKEAPDFTMPDVNGKQIKLSSFRGKYVLVDFWASWCGPCRAENPNVVKAYHQFKDKNFTILGVSLDRPGQKEQWMKAVHDDQLTWTQVSDLQYWQSPVIQLYRFEGIPFNVLVDPAGKVIAQGLRGPGLEAKLAEVLQ